MAVQVTNKKGDSITLYNPSERSAKYCDELHTGKNKVTGVELSDTQKSYRSGYLKARKESAKIYCKKNGIKSKAVKRKSK